MSITPFGRSNPRAREPVTDLTLQAGAGPAWSCGYDDHRLPPVRPGGNQGFHTASLWAVEAAMVAFYARQTHGFGQHVDVSMYAACNVTTEAATYEWLVAQATVQRQTFRHAAVRETPPRLMRSADGGSVIGALPRRASEFRALSEWLVELGLVDQFEEFFFLEMGVERGRRPRSPRSRRIPEAAAIYQAGDRTRCGSWRSISPAGVLRRGTAARAFRRPCCTPPRRSSATSTSSPVAFRWRSTTTTSAGRSSTRGRVPGPRLAVAGPRARAPHLDEHARADHWARLDQVAVTGGQTNVTEKFESRVIVSGLGLSDIGRGLGRGGLDLALDAALGAIADAGLQRSDIDGRGVHAVRGPAPRGGRRRVGPEAELDGRRQLRCPAGGDDQRGHGRRVGPVPTRPRLPFGRATRRPARQRLRAPCPNPSGPWEWHVPFHEYSAVNLMAMQARRHMHEYGTTKEQLGWIALNAVGTTRRSTSKAVLRAPMTMDDYLDAPMISDPLGRLDCDLPIDGAVGLVLSAAETGAGLPNPPVRLEAVGLRQSRHARLGARGRTSRPWLPRMRPHRCGLGPICTPADVDVAELYDGFSILTLSWLEALGFCGEGEAGAFVDGGQRIGLGGELPLNTYGGQLSAGRLHGFWLFHEAVLQLRGQAGRRQVPGAQVAVTSAGGGFRCGCILLTA